jgi:prolyl 4-hydroxylase
MNKKPSWINIYKNALTKDECENVIKFSKEKFFKQPLLSGESGRTSSQFFIEKGLDVVSKIEEFTVSCLPTYNKLILPVENQEPTSIVMYEKGEQYEAHWDYFNPKLHPKEYETFVVPSGSNRVATAIFYLNDGFEGGETYFPKIDFKIKPELGMCITFLNMFDDDEFNEESLHAGLPVTGGEKYIATKWVRGKEFKQ